MFTLSELQSPRRLAWSLGLLNAGLAGVFVTVLLESPWRLLFALVTISGLALYGLEMVAILRARKRRVLDWGLRYFLTALSLYAPLSGLALVLCWPSLPVTVFTGQLENLYGWVGLVGVVSFAILGMLYKIVPFLVWYHAYSREIGRCRVPALGELCSAPLQAVTYWLLVASLLGVSLATVLSHERAVRWSCALLGLSLVLFAANTAKILRHFFRPTLAPLGRSAVLKQSL
jgi:hypothetical protein